MQKASVPCAAPHTTMANAGRRSVQEAIDHVAWSFSSKVCAHAAPLRQTLEDIESGLETHSVGLKASLDTLCKQLVSMQRYVSEAARQSDGGLADAVAGVDVTLTETWKDASSTLAAMRELVSSGLATLQGEHAAESIQREMDELRTILTEKAQSELASIAQTRVVLTEQVACIRREIAAEQEALSQLSQQNAAMAADASSMQATFAAISEGARGAGDALALAEDEQRRHRADAMERMMFGLKEIVSRELDRLDQNSMQVEMATQAKLVQIIDQSEQGQEKLSAMKDHFCEANTRVAKVVRDWASGVHATCGEIETVHENMNIAIGTLNTTRLQAVDRVQDVQTQVFEWDDSCKCITELAKHVQESVSSLETAQDSLMQGWEHARDTVQCQGKRVGEILEEAATTNLAVAKHGLAARNVADIQADMQDKFGLALKIVEDLSKEHDAHRDSLTDVAQLVAEEDDALAATLKLTQRTPRINVYNVDAVKAKSTRASYPGSVASWQCSTSASGSPSDVAFQPEDDDAAIFEDDEGDIENFQSLSQRPTETEIEAEFLTSYGQPIVPVWLAAADVEETCKGGAVNQVMPAKQSAQSGRDVLKEVQRSSLYCR